VRQWTAGDRIGHDMPRQSTVYEVLIASPSDVITERAVLTEVVEDWNSANSRSRAISLQAIRWELDAVPSVGDTPQHIINKQLVENADVLVVVFWTRLGTPTGGALSGTVAEIEHVRSHGKRVLLYFSDADIPHKHDVDQFRLLKEYQKSLGDQALYQTFSGADDLRRRSSRDLARIVNELTSKTVALPFGQQPAQTSRGSFARVMLQPGTTMTQGPLKIVRVFGTIENLSVSKRIREYSCKLSVPSPCLTFGHTSYPMEVASDDPKYRSFRHTERNQGDVFIHPGDRFQIVSNRYRCRTPKPRSAGAMSRNGCDRRSCSGWRGAGVSKNRQRTNGDVNGDRLDRGWRPARERPVVEL
jgi:hypothetical protein